MASEIFQRLNKMSERVAVMESEIKDLKNMPPRVQAVEQAVGVLEIHISGVRDDIVKAQKEQKATTMAIQHIDKKVGRLFWTGAGVFMVCSLLIGAANLYNTWLSIQQRQADIAQQHQGMANR